MTKLPASVASYYKQAPEIHKRSLAEMRERILELLPGAAEVIKYGMPTFVVEGEAIAGLMCHKQHIGYYPYSGSIISLFPEIEEKYKTSRGAIQVPTGKLLPKGEIKKLIKARLKMAGL